MTGPLAGPGQRALCNEPLPGPHELLPDRRVEHPVLNALLPEILARLAAPDAITAYYEDSPYDGG